MGHAAGTGEATRNEKRIMSQPPQGSGREQQLLRHARREGLLVLVVWAIALVWSTLGSWLMGYGRDGKDVPLVFGMPDWIFWNVLVPWVGCFGFALWFCFFC